MDVSARARRRLQLTPIPVRFMAEGSESTGVLKSASRAGLFIATATLPHPGCAVVVQFASPAGPLVTVRGEVRWTTRPNERPDVQNGFGVMLHEPPAEYSDFYVWAMDEAEKPELDDV